MRKNISKALAPLLAATLCTGTVLAAGDGANEPGFVPPPQDRSKPPAPPRTASSAETLDACCCCPVTPLSRTEAKKPPKPPVLVTKLRDTRVPEPEAPPETSPQKRATKAKGE
ncbi:MAG: hypothetical protein HQ523_00260 [Lentisphaerae bacterium]|nr:hypothetical protein [Lentisphaerota bacterium]